MAWMTNDQLRAAWHYIDARALDQTKRAETRRMMLEDAAAPTPPASSKRSAPSLCIAIDHVVTPDAASRDEDPSAARMNVLRHRAHRQQLTAPRLRCSPALPLLNTAG